MTYFDTLIIYLYSYFPAIMLGLFFWWFDRFERKSFMLVFIAFFWGAFGAGLLSYFWNTIFYLVLEIYQKDASTTNDMLVSVMIAPFVEELTKGLIIVFLFFFKKINNITDGILLGVIIGLGFAAAENVHYALVVTYPSSGELAMWHNLWFREIHTTLLHASGTAVWGAIIGFARNLNRAQQYFALVIGFILAMVTHGFWNFLASYVNNIDAGFNIIEIIMRLELCVIFGMLLVLFVSSLFYQSQTIITELTEECEQNNLPWEHLGFFASLVRKPKKYTLPRTIKPAAYAKLGVRLAFKKRDYRFHPSAELKLEILNLQKQLHEIVQPQGSIANHNQYAV